MFGNFFFGLPLCGYVFVLANLILEIVWGTSLSIVMFLAMLGDVIFGDLVLTLEIMIQALIVET